MPTMDVVRLHGVRDLRLSREAVPDPVPGHSLIRLTAVGLCGSDLHWYTDGGIGDATLSRPVVPGHEFAGVVVRGDREGRRVAVDPALPCGACFMCLEGHPNLCPSVGFAGHGVVDGAFREYMVWRDDRLHVVPDSISDAAAAMLEPLGVAIHAFDLGHVRLGATVSVIGCGPIGLLLCQVARVGGADRVIAVDPLEHRRAVALALGADAALAPDEARASWGSIAGHGVDAAFEVAGTDDAIDQAMRGVRPGGRVVLAGIPADDRSTFTASLARRKGLTIAMARRMKEVYPRAIRLVERGLVDVEGLITSRFDLHHTDEAFRTASGRTGIKVVVEIGDFATSPAERRDHGA
jgi:L-iditol 2-dehydrogenase